MRENRHRYDELLESQGGGCAICGRPPSAKRKLDMDHDHRGMYIRGLLCIRCNRAIHSWMDEEWMASATTYLRKAKENYG